MTVLGSVLRRSSPENPSFSLRDPALADWLTGGTSSAGVAVTERRVLGLPAYYRGLAITAGTLAAMPTKLYRNGTRTRVRTTTVLDNPNPRQTPFEYWVTTYLGAIAWGNAFSRKLRDGADIVRQVWPIHPSRVRVEEEDPTDADPAGKLFLVRDRHGAEKRYRSWDIFHLPYMSMDGVQGIRPFQVFAHSLGIAIAADNAAASFYKHGTQVAGALKTEQKLDPTAAEALKLRWREKVGGSHHFNDIVVLDRGTDFVPISIPPGDAQLLESRQWSVSEIARMVGTPPHLVGDVEKSTSWGTGIEEQVLGWVKFTLQAFISLAEQRITRELLPGGWTSGSWFCELDANNLMRGDAASRGSFYQRGITDGWLSRAEARHFETLEPAPDEAGLDEFIVPSNMTIISVDGQLVPASAAGANTGD